MIGWLAKLETVRKAETPSEREAIYRFRYHTYVEELRHQAEAHRARKWLEEEEREDSSATLLYTGSLEDPTSAVRVQAWKPGEVPPGVAERISMDRFPGIGRLAVSHIGRMTLCRSLRGRLVLPALLAGAYEFLVGEKGADVAFLDCVPGLVRHYRQLGARPYGGRLVDLGYSPGIPLVIVLSDHEHLKRSGSIMAPLVKKYFGPGKRPPLDVAPYKELFDDGAVPVEFDPEKVWEALQERLLAGDERIPTFVDALSPGTLFHLSESGYLLDVKAGDLLTRAGIGQREMFVILEGACEVEGAGKRIALLDKGDLFGEIAFFSETGERSATVRALSDGKLLVLRQEFLDDLATNDPEAACQILLNVGRIMAERMSAMVRAAAADAPDHEP
jgi:Cyclic nucleotide-binding domain